MLQVGVIRFSTEASVDLNLTNDIGFALGTVKELTNYNDGWTSLHLGMEKYQGMIADHGSQNPNATKLLVAISDGQMVNDYFDDHYYSNFQEVVAATRLIKAMNHTIVGIYVNSEAGSEATFRGEQEMYWFSSCTTNDCMQGTSAECYELAHNDNVMAKYDKGGCTDYERDGSKCLENEGYCCTKTCEGINATCDQEWKGGCQMYDSSQDCSVDCLYYFDGTFEELDALAGPLASDITKSLAGSIVGAKSQEIDESAKCIFDPAWFSCLILILPLIMYSRTQHHRT